MRTLYLGRDSQTFGPFTDADLTRMTQSGELRSYQWIWESQDKGWQPLFSPPPPPPSLATAIPKSEIPSIEASQTAKAPPTERRATPRPTGVFVPKAPELQVICHDLLNMMSATLRELDATGGILVSRDYSQEVPPFKRGGKVWLHLLNAETSLTEKVEARLVRFTRNNGQWEYKFTWVHHPLMLGGQPGSLAP